MVFVTCGLGGELERGSTCGSRIGTRNGNSTVGVVTRPFGFEGAQRRQKSLDGLKQLEEKKVDTLITIPNDRILYY